MRFLRNLTAEVILVGGTIILILISIPFVLIEVLFHTGLLTATLWIGAIYLVWRWWQRNKERISDR